MRLTHMERLVCTGEQLAPFHQAVNVSTQYYPKQFWSLKRRGRRVLLERICFQTAASSPEISTVVFHCVSVTLTQEMPLSAFVTFSTALRKSRFNVISLRRQKTKSPTAHDLKLKKKVFLLKPPLNHCWTSNCVDVTCSRVTRRLHS